MDNFKKKLEKLKELTEVQCADGTWDYDPYIQGMANGLILAQSIMTDGGEIELVFLEAPKVWKAN